MPSLNVPEPDLPIRYHANGLVPAIAQQHDTGEVLMLAWMNAASVAETLATGRVCYWSRSRAALWRKGETSGQVQTLRELRLDCDGDTLLLLVDQRGAACHTGQRSCFHRAVRAGVLATITTPLVDPASLYAPSPSGRGLAPAPHPDPLPEGEGEEKGEEGAWSLVTSASGRRP